MAGLGWDHGATSETTLVWAGRPGRSNAARLWLVVSYSGHRERINYRSIRKALACKSLPDVERILGQGSDKKPARFSVPSGLAGPWDERKALYWSDEKGAIAVTCAADGRVANAIYVGSEREPTPLDKLLEWLRL